MIELGWNDARSTSPITRTRAPCVRVIFKIWPFTRSRHQRERVTQIFGKMHLKQGVVRTWGCTRASSTNQATQLRDPRVRVTWKLSHTMLSRDPRVCVTCDTQLIQISAKYLIFSSPNQNLFFSFLFLSSFFFLLYSFSLFTFFLPYFSHPIIKVLFFLSLLFTFLLLFLLMFSSFSFYSYNWC